MILIEECWMMNGCWMKKWDGNEGDGDGRGRIKLNIKIIVKIKFKTSFNLKN